MVQETSGVRGQGLFLSGEFFAIADQKGYDDKAGVHWEPVKLTLAVGDSTVRVEYRSRQDALDALGGVQPERGTWCTVPVYAQGPWDPEARRRGLVFYSGRRLQSAG